MNAVDEARVVAAGWQHGQAVRVPFPSVREALRAARDAIDDFTWAVDHIEVDGETVLDSREIAERTAYGRFDDLPEPT